VVTPTGTDDIATDIGGDVIHALTKQGVAHMYDFSQNFIPGQADHERGYWRDVGSLDAYYEANMDLLAPVPPFSLYNKEWPVYSLQLPLPPAKLGHGRSGEHGKISNSLLCAARLPRRRQ
jgi:glucose-1-phosphate adenylyltransferase